jgi:hypothetical protein
MPLVLQKEGTTLSYVNLVWAMPPTLTVWAQLQILSTQEGKKYNVGNSTLGAFI